MANEKAEIRDLLGSVAGEETVASIGDDDLFFEDRVIDSLHLMSIVDQFERRFGIKVSGSDLSPDNFGSVSAMAEFLSSKRGG